MHGETRGAPCMRDALRRRNCVGLPPRAVASGCHGQTGPGSGRRRRRRRRRSARRLAPRWAGRGAPRRLDRGRSARRRRPDGEPSQHPRGAARALHHQGLHARGEEAHPARRLPAQRDRARRPEPHEPGQQGDRAAHHQQGEVPRGSQGPRHPDARAARAVRRREHGTHLDQREGGVVLHRHLRVPEQGLRAAVRVDAPHARQEGLRAAGQAPLRADGVEHRVPR